MADDITTVQQLKSRMAQHVRERDWEQFHTPKNLSMDIAIEAAELMEKFQWVDSAASYEQLRANRDEIEQELVDVLAGVLSLANACNIDLSDAYERKMILNVQKYPVEKCKGRSDKYDTY